MIRVLITCLALAVRVSAHAAPPTGFVVEPIGGTFQGVVGAEFLPDGALLAWEYGGKVWRIEPNGTRQSQPVLDITDEVGRWGDHGLLGLALHPNFASNGYMYLLYAVDREHFLRGGSGAYNPGASIPEQASISRLTRYRVTKESGWRATDASSRTVLLGRDATDGFPLVNRCHGECSLVFGEDETLLVGFGDSASPWYVDHGPEGYTHDGYATQAIADGTLRAKSHVGAFRAQLVDDLSGKILRLDPDTGLGVPSNPFYDPAAPEAPRSKVWALGLRNPYRMTRLPDTGAHDPAAGDPGVLVVGDIGWDDREEINLVTHGGMNFGWPLYEGITPMTYTASSSTWPVFHGLRTRNVDAGVASMSGCAVAFADLLAPPGASHWVDGCALTQMEDGSTSTGLFARQHGGFSGRGYVDFAAADGEFAEATVPVAAAGATTLAIRYALGGTGTRRMNLLIDGVPSQQVEFIATGRWDVWQWLHVPLDVAAGSRRVRLASLGESGPNIDGVVLFRGVNPAVLTGTSSPRFRHSPPIIDAPQPPTAVTPARVPDFTGSVPWRAVDASGYPFISEPFTSECVVAGPRIDSGDWPAPWRGRVFVGDYTARWIRAIELDQDRAVKSVLPFDTAAGIVMWLGRSPLNGDLYVARFNDLVRIRYQPSGNRPPVVQCRVATRHGPSPLLVSFDASASTDPEGGPLQFDWEFGDGDVGSGPTITHAFVAPAGEPHRFDVRLTVRDSEGGSVTRTESVWPGNHPPQVSLLVPIDGQRYDARSPGILALRPTITEPDGQSVSCVWSLTLLHDTHGHPEGTFAEPELDLELFATPCGGSFYAFRLDLDVTDALGLSTRLTRTLYPRCQPCLGDIDGSGAVDAGDIGAMLLVFGVCPEAVPGCPGDIDGSGAADAGDIGLTLLMFGACE